MDWGNLKSIAFSDVFLLIKKILPNLYRYYTRQLDASLLLLLLAPFPFFQWQPTKIAILLLLLPRLGESVSTCKGFQIQTSSPMLTFILNSTLAFVRAILPLLVENRTPEHLGYFCFPWQYPALQMLPVWDIWACPQQHWTLVIPYCENILPYTSK